MPARTASRRFPLRTVVSALRAAIRPGSPGIAERLAAVPRLVRATLRGEYAGASATHLLALGAAVAYVVSPIDVLPEALLAVFGVADDALVLGWLAAALVTDTEAFLAWERAGRPTGAPTHHADASGRGGQGTPQDASDVEWQARHSAAHQVVQSSVVR